MNTRNNDESLALQAVAKRFTATFDQSNRLRVRGKLIGVTVKSLKARAAETSAKPGLRFDKVVNWLISYLHSEFNRLVPDGSTVLVSVTAPIRLAAKTASAVRDRTHALLRSSRRNAEEMIHGNDVHIRVLRGVPKRLPKLLAFVHNPTSDPILFFDIAGEFIRFLAADEGTTGEWLVLVSPLSPSYLQAYRSIYTQLGKASPFEKVLVVFPNFHVELLSE